MDSSPQQDTVKKWKASLFRPETAGILEQMAFMVGINIIILFFIDILYTRMSGFSFRPSAHNRVLGVYTKPSLKRIQYSQPAKKYVDEMSGKGLTLAGLGAPTIQTIIADEMNKERGGRGISMSRPSVVSHSSAPHSGHSSGGALNLAGQQPSPQPYHGNGLRLAGQRMSRSGCGVDLPGQLLKAKLARNVKKSKKGGRLTHPIGKGDKMTSGEYDSGKSPSKLMKMDGGRMDFHSFTRDMIHKEIMPAIHEALDLPALKPETYKKILDRVKTKVNDAKSLNKYAREVADKHLPIVIKIQHRKLGGKGLLDSKFFTEPLHEGLLPEEKTPLKNAMNHLQAPFGEAFVRFTKWLVKKGIENMRMRSQQSGGYLIKNSEKRRKVRQFFKDFSHGMRMVLSPAAKLLGAPALVALGVPPQFAKPIAQLTSQGIAGADDLIQKRGKRHGLR